MPGQIEINIVAALYPRGKDPGTHCTGGWVGPRAGLDTEVREKNLFPPPGIEPRSPGHPVSSQTLYCLSYPLLLVNDDKLERSGREQSWLILKYYPCIRLEGLRYSIRIAGRQGRKGEEMRKTVHGNVE
jgi:hypothetical protein